MFVKRKNAEILVIMVRSFVFDFDGNKFWGKGILWIFVFYFVLIIIYYNFL